MGADRPRWIDKACIYKQLAAEWAYRLNAVGPPPPRWQDEAGDLLHRDLWPTTWLAHCISLGYARKRIDLTPENCRKVTAR